MCQRQQHTSYQWHVCLVFDLFQDCHERCWLPRILSVDALLISIIIQESFATRYFQHWISKIYFLTQLLCYAAKIIFDSPQPPLLLIHTGRQKPFFSVSTKLQKTQQSPNSFWWCLSTRYTVRCKTSKRKPVMVICSAKLYTEGNTQKMLFYLAMYLFYPLFFLSRNNWVCIFSQTALHAKISNSSEKFRVSFLPLVRILFFIYSYFRGEEDMLMHIILCCLLF